MFDLSRVNDLLGRVVGTLAENVVVPFEKFHQKRMEKMGAVKFGTIRVSINDSIQLGKSKPRKVLNIDNNSLLLSNIKKPTRGMRFEGTRYLFWDEGTKKYYSRSASGMSSKDTIHDPSEVKVIKGAG